MDSWYMYLVIISQNIHLILEYEICFFGLMNVEQIEIDVAGVWLIRACHDEHILILSFFQQLSIQQALTMMHNNMCECCLSWSKLEVKGEPKIQQAIYHNG